MNEEKALQIVKTGHSGETEHRNWERSKDSNMPPWVWSGCYVILYTFLYFEIFQKRLIWLNIISIMYIYTYYRKNVKKLIVAKNNFLFIRFYIF